MDFPGKRRVPRLLGAHLPGVDYTIAATAAARANRGALLVAYAALPAFADVLGALESLRSNGQHVAVLSNGTMPMLKLALSSAKLVGLLDIIISIDEIAVYKPDRRAFELALRHLAVAPSEVRFVSANAWDAAGARAAGLSVTWVNRDHRPPEYQIPSSICDLNDFVRKLATGRSPVIDIGYPTAGCQKQRKELLVRARFAGRDLHHTSQRHRAGRGQFFSAHLEALQAYRGPPASDFGVP